MAALLGGLVGFERERSGKVAGLRTHTLVSGGAALLSIISIKLFQIFPFLAFSDNYQNCRQIFIHRFNGEV